MQWLPVRLPDQLPLTTIVGYRMRFFHSTGQLHKGDANSVLFPRFTGDPGIRSKLQKYLRSRSAPYWVWTAPNPWNWSTSRNYTHSELRFRVLLSEGGAEGVEAARVSP
jgi:hypothetical protein